MQSGIPDLKNQDNRYTELQPSLPGRTKKHTTWIQLILALEAKQGGPG